MYTEALACARFFDASRDRRRLALRHYADVNPSSGRLAVINVFLMGCCSGGCRVLFLDRRWRRLDMPGLLRLLLSTVMVSSSLAPQARADTPADARVYAVSYVEVIASSRATAIAALKQYRDARRKQDGCVRLELFEQGGRPGHFAVVETWQDQKAFDARGAASRKQLLDTLQPIRVSDYDERPYKTLTVGSASPAANSHAITVVSHVDTAPGGQVPGLLERLAEASRQDAGNVRFDVLQHTLRANHFTVIETWQGQKALDAHAAAAHTRQYRDELQPMTGSPLDERVYRAVE
jgi:quinol monooxygenase YgiN